MKKLMTTITQNRTNNVIIKTIIILKSFHSIFNISSIKDIQIITSPWCVYNHHTQLLFALSTKKDQWPHLITTTSCVHWETTITTSAHCYQLCPLGDHNYHCWLLLPVVSTGRKQSPHQITATSFFHWEPTITTSDHYYQLCPLEDQTPHSRSLLPVFFTESPKSPHLITATRFFSTGRQQSQHMITTTSCVH